MTKQEAIKWHMDNVKISKQVSDCTYKYGYTYKLMPCTYEEAERAVDFREKNNTPLIGFSCENQSKWTY